MPVFLYKAKLIRVIDGDTIEFDIDLGFYIHLHEKIRLYGIDVWESRHKNPEHRAKGLEAKAFVKDQMRAASEIEVNIVKWSGKYGRGIGAVNYKIGDEWSRLHAELERRGFKKEALG